MKNTVNAIHFESTNSLIVVFVREKTLPHYYKPTRSSMARCRKLIEDRIPVVYISQTSLNVWYSF